jgi:CBS domain-containing protein
LIAEIQSQLNKENKMKVQDVMSSNVSSCRSENNLAAVATMMWDGDCGVVPVVDDAGKVIGMITDRDIAIAAATKGRPASEVTVGEVIANRVHTCALNEDLQSALKTFRQEKVRRLPVVNDEGILQGILSLNDVILRAEEAKGNYVPEISYEDAMSTLKAICEHRTSTAVASA